MSRDWKPGDVGTWDGMGVVMCVPLEPSDVHGWPKFANRWGGFSFYDRARPLVVIDPEDRGDVEALRKVLSDSGAFTGLRKGNVSKIQQALREFADPKPPKPDEPTGRYAVVEDDKALEWVRADVVGINQWKCLTLDRWVDYDQIDVVRVLSEGVDA